MLVDCADVFSPDEWTAKHREFNVRRQTSRTLRGRGAPCHHGRHRTNSGRRCCHERHLLRSVAAVRRPLGLLVLTRPTAYCTDATHKWPLTYSVFVISFTYICRSLVHDRSKNNANFLSGCFTFVDGDSSGVKYLVYLISMCYTSVTWVNWCCNCRGSQPREFPPRENLGLSRN